MLEEPMLDKIKMKAESYKVSKHANDSNNQHFDAFVNPALNGAVQCVTVCCFLAFCVVSFSCNLMDLCNFPLFILGFCGSYQNCMSEIFFSASVVGSIPDDFILIQLCVHTTQFRNA